MVFVGGAKKFHSRVTHLEGVVVMMGVVFSARKTRILVRIVAAIVESVTRQRNVYAFAVTASEFLLRTFLTQFWGKRYIQFFA